MAKKAKTPLPREVSKRRLARWEQERRRRRITLAIGAAVIAVIVVVIVYGIYATMVAPGRERVATVGGTHLTFSDFVTTLRLSPLTQSSARDALTATINYEIVRQGAAQLSLAVTQAEIDAELRQTFLGEGEEEISEEEFQNRYAYVLEQLGVTKGQYEDAVTTQLLAVKIEELQKNQVPEVGALIPHVHVGVVEVYTEPQAQQVIVRLEDGEDLAAVAAEYNGGDMGWVPQGMMSLEIEQFAFAQQSGNATDYFLRTEGYTVVQVLEPAQDMPLADEDTRQLLQDNALAYWFEVKWEELVTWEVDDERLADIFLRAMDQLG